MADQHQQRPGRRLFEDLQHRIRGVAVHLLGAVDDDDAPPLLRRGQPQKLADLARILDHDIAAQALAARVPGAFDGQQIGVAAGRDAAKGAAFRVDGEPGFAKAAAKIGRVVAAALGQKEAGKAKGQGRLADAARAAQQDRVRQHPGPVEPFELALGALVAEEIRVRPRRGRALRRGRRLYCAGHAGRGPRAIGRGRGRMRCRFMRY